MVAVGLERRTHFCGQGKRIQRMEMSGPQGRP